MEAAGPVSRSQVNRHPHPNSQGVGWVGLRRELKRRRQPACELLGTVWWRLLSSLKQGQLLS